MTLAGQRWVVALAMLASVIYQARAQDYESGPVRKLPGWFQLGGELQGRAELNSGEDGGADGFYLSRLRLRLKIQPTRWVSVHLEGQDTRDYRIGRGAQLDGRWNPVDLRQAYAVFGSLERGFEVRFGRQEISLGDERLIGSDREWGPSGTVYDAMRIALGAERKSVEAFSAFPVQPNRRRPDRFDRTNHLNGLVGRFESKAGSVIEPYLLWRRGSKTRSLVDEAGHRDVLVPGVRLAGLLRSDLDYNAEMVFERGHVAGDRIKAWAGHWELNWNPMGANIGPRIGVEFNYSSGDRDPADGRHETFDDLFSGGYNPAGFADPLIWRNLTYPGLVVWVPLSRRWKTNAGLRTLHLSHRSDGVYLGGDAYAVRNPAASSSHFGTQVFTSAFYEASSRWKLAAGYLHLFAGVYLEQTQVPRLPPSAFYLLSNFTF